MVKKPHRCTACQKQCRGIGRIARVTRGNRRRASRRRSCRCPCCGRRGNTRPRTAPRARRQRRRRRRFRAGDLGLQAADLDDEDERRRHEANHDGVDLLEPAGHGCASGLDLGHGALGRNEPADDDAGKQRAHGHEYGVGHLVKERQPSRARTARGWIPRGWRHGRARCRSGSTRESRHPRR